MLKRLLAQYSVTNAMWATQTGTKLENLERKNLPVFREKLQKCLRNFTLLELGKFPTCKKVLIEED